MKTPWSEMGRMLTADEWGALKSWRKNNPSLTLKLGMKRDDGLVFVHFNRESRNGERWATPEWLAKDRAHHVARHKKRRESKEYVEKERSVHKNRYRSDPVYRAKILVIARKENARRWDENKDAIKAASRLRYATDKEYRDHINLNCKVWRQNNRHTCNAMSRRRWARQRALIAPGFDQFQVKLIYKISQIASRMRRGDKIVVDHVIPMASGGFHHQDNLGLMPWKLNCSKNDDPFWMSNDWKDWRDVPESLWPEKLAPKYRELILIHPRQTGPGMSPIKSGPPPVRY